MNRVRKRVPAAICSNFGEEPSQRGRGERLRSRLGSALWVPREVWFLILDFVELECILTLRHVSLSLVPLCAFYIEEQCPSVAALMPFSLQVQRGESQWMIRLTSSRMAVSRDGCLVATSGFQWLARVLTWIEALIVPGSISPARGSWAPVLSTSPLQMTAAKTPSSSSNASSQGHAPALPAVESKPGALLAGPDSAEAAPAAVSSGSSAGLSSPDEQHLAHPCAEPGNRPFSSNMCLLRGPYCSQYVPCTIRPILIDQRKTSFLRIRNMLDLCDEMLSESMSMDGLMLAATDTVE
ncbi:hypothetical protein DIPPA_23507 [Diplonema papillatum]|nr:hypothetical protein DIPPA_23507 [Diplonema papillatum]